MNEYSFDGIGIGQEHSFERTIVLEDVETFSKLTGDYNPLHLDDAYAKTTDMGGVIVHGMLLSSLFSTLVGMYLPGKYCLYLSQDVQFKNSVKPGQKLTIKGVVVKKIDALKIIEIETTICDESNTVIVLGSAKVKVLK